MKNFSSLVLLSSVYLLTGLLGLQTAVILQPLMYPPAGEEAIIPPIVSNPESPTASAQVFLYILLMTGVLLLLIKYKLRPLIKILVSLSVLFGLFLTTTLLFDWLGLIISLFFVLLFLLRRGDYNVINLILVFTISGIGAVLGMSLSLFPALLLLTALAVYDYISVYVTKHMVTLAESSKGSLPFMFLIPIGGKELGLGTGDIAIPLMLCVSIMKDYGVGYAIPTMFGGLLGLVALFFYIEQKKEHAAMPALPPITAGLLFGLGLCKLFLG